MILEKLNYYLSFLIIILLLQSCSSDQNNPDNPNQPPIGVFYVSLNGSDNNDGSINSPWRTIQYGMNNISAGQTLIILDGIYNEAVTINKSGSLNKPIFIKSNSIRGSIINGNSINASYGITIKNGVSYVKIDGLVINNFKGWGVYIENGVSFIDLTNMEIRNNGDSGIRIDSAHDITMTNLFIHNNKGQGLDCISCINITITNCISSSNSGDTWMDGFGFENSSYNITLDNCVAENNTGDGFDSKGNNTIIKNCKSKYNSREGIKLWGKNSIIQNCISENNGRAGIVLKDGGDYTVKQTIVRNNGFKDNDFAIYVAYDEQAPTKLIMLNNSIYYNYGHVHLGRVVQIASEDYNNFYNDTNCEIYWGNSPKKCYSRANINNKLWFQDTGFGEHSTSIPP